jgi:hypothetical protein
MSLPVVGTAVNYYWKSGQASTPALVHNVDDINGVIMVTYISPAVYSPNFPGAPIFTSPWSSQGTGVGQWEPMS